MSLALIGASLGGLRAVGKGASHKGVPVTWLRRGGSASYVVAVGEGSYPSP